MAATYSSLVGLAVGGKYEIRRVIGAGGMGVVCEAMHLDLGKRVALKLIDKSMKESDAIIARFRREAKAAGRINSDHIVDVFDVNADARVGLYMVMEHLSGEDLQARLEKEKRIDTKTAVMIAHQIARGLAKAHEAGVIHRDLKPANVFLTMRDNGQLLVKLLDFGVSKILREETGDARITGTGTPIGTPLYMSPEQAEGKDDVDGRADIWSLGAVLYEALAGAAPFADRGSYHATIVGILTSRPKLLQDAAPWVPAELAKVVDAMLVHDRDARIPNAGAVTQRLLDAFPTVLPDGTGRHTAVIVSQTQAAVDMTGDTEVFTSPGLGPGIRITPHTPHAAVTVHTPQPLTVPPSTHAPSPRRSAEDSAKTVPNAATGESAAVSAHEQPISDRTIAPTPVNIPRRDASSSQGVSLPGTPPAIDPLPGGNIPPALESNPAETIRDDELAARMDRKRRLKTAALLLVVAAVAVGGYQLGQRASTKDAQPSPPPSTTTTPNATATATVTATATTSAAPTASAPAEPAPSVTASITTNASALPNAPTATTPSPRPRKAAPAKPAGSAEKPATPYDEPPPPDPPPSY
jgi:eukaryotic-like serine/threonine-protein kinase